MEKQHEEVSDPWDKYINMVNVSLTVPRHPVSLRMNHSHNKLPTLNLSNITKRRQRINES